MKTKECVDCNTIFRLRIKIDGIVKDKRSHIRCDSCMIKYNSLLEEFLNSYKTCTNCGNEKIGAEFTRKIAKLPTDVCRICNKKSYKLQYSLSDKGKLSKTSYMKTEAFKESKRKTKHNYMQTDKGKNLARAFKQTDKGRVIQKNIAKRKYSFSYMHQASF